MTILQELLYLSEAKEKNLIGLTIYGKLITDKTPTEHWPGNFDCSFNQLVSLEGAPSEVGGYFYCYDNKLESLEGAPSSVGGYFDCSYNQLKNLKDIHKILKKMDGSFFAHSNPIKSHVLGLLKIQGCRKVIIDNQEVQDILNKYLPNTKGDKAVIECGFELQDAGLDEYAKI